MKEEGCAAVVCVEERWTTVALLGGKRLRCWVGERWTTAR